MKDINIGEWKNRLLREVLLPSKYFKKGDQTKLGKVEQSPSGNLLVNGHDIDEYSIEDLKDSFTKAEDNLYKRVTGKEPKASSKNKFRDLKEGENQLWEEVASIMGVDNMSNFDDIIKELKLAGFKIIKDE